MDSAERHSAELSLPHVWRALSARAAVVIGAGTALVSLFVSTPVWVASARGAVAWLLVHIVARACESSLAPTPVGKHSPPANHDRPR